MGTVATQMTSRGTNMQHADFNEEIRELNLSYLMIAQQMIRTDRTTAIVRLGVTNEMAEALDSLTISQVAALATSNQLLCRFRFDERTLKALLSSYKRSPMLTQSHATLLLAQQSSEALA
jgi:flagellar transcriptional activator FlhD